MSVSNVIGADGALASVLQIDAPLEFAKFAAVETHGDESIEMRGEVGLLSRRIRIRGGDADEFPQFRSLWESETGAQVIVSQYLDWISPVEYAEERGAAQLSGVRVAQGGVHGYDDRPALGFHALGALGSNGERACYVQSCVISDAFNIGIHVKLTGGVRISNSIVHNTLGSSVRLQSQGNTLEGNLALSAVTRLTHRGRDSRSTLRNVNWEDYVANFELDTKLPCTCPFPLTEALAACACGAAATAGSVVRGNVAAGSHRLGFKFSTPPALCDDDDDDGASGGASGSVFDDNAAHTNLLGFALHFSPPAACVAVTRLTVWRAWTFGVWGSADYATVKLQRIAVADSKVRPTHARTNPRTS
eukprot:2608484-Pleurochrysis_carterae.AAC.1